MGYLKIKYLYRYITVIIHKYYINTNVTYKSKNLRDQILPDIYRNLIIPKENNQNHISQRPCPPL